MLRRYRTGPDSRGRDRLYESQGGLRRIYIEYSGNDSFNHQVKVTRGVLEQQCSDMLTQFFKELRVRVKEERKARKLLAAQEENKEHGGNVYDE